MSVKNRISVMIGPSGLKKYILLRRFLSSLKVKVSDSDLALLSEYKAKFPQVMTAKETIEYIIDNKVSLGRYGDAEFDISLEKNKNDPYQKPSKVLTKRLNEILRHGTDDKILICIPPFNYKTNNIKRYHGRLSFWEWYWLSRYSELSSLFTSEKYGNSFATRESAFHECKLSTIQKIWDGRKVCFIYGEGGRFNHNSEIFNNIESKEVIHVAPTSAFDNYDEIYQRCLGLEQDTLFLVAAGPMATVLSFDLSRNGFQSIDVGHLPNSYDEFLGLIVSPESLPLVSAKSDK
jgi:glycosyltransferase family protein